MIPGRSFSAVNANRMRCKLRLSFFMVKCVFVMNVFILSNSNKKKLWIVLNGLHVQNLVTVLTLIFFYSLNSEQNSALIVFKILNSAAPLRSREYWVDLLEYHGILYFHIDVTIFDFISKRNYNEYMARIFNRFSEFARVFVKQNKKRMVQYKGKIQDQRDREKHWLQYDIYCSWK
jgi:hypothetical protein